MSAIAIDWPEIGCMQDTGEVYKDHQAARILAAKAVQSEYIHLGEPITRVRVGRGRWDGVRLDLLYICLDLNPYLYNLFLCCFLKFHYPLQL